MEKYIVNTLPSCCCCLYLAEQCSVRIMKNACVPASVYILSRFQLAENNNRHTVQAKQHWKHILCTNCGQSTLCL